MDKDFLKYLRDLIASTLLGILLGLAAGSYCMAVGAEIGEEQDTECTTTYTEQRPTEFHSYVYEDGEWVYKRQLNAVEVLKQLLEKQKTEATCE